MSTIRRTAKNISVLTVSQFFISILTLVLSIFIARRLGDLAFGKYSFALSFSTIFFAVPTGLDSLIVRDVSKDNTLASKYLGNVIVMKGILAIAILGLISIITNQAHYSDDKIIIILIFSLYSAILTVSGTFKMIFQSFGKMEYQALIQIITQSIVVLLGLTAIFLGYGLITIALIFVIGSFLDLVLSFYINNKFVKLSIEIDANLWERIIKTALLLSFMPLAAIIYTRIDTIMLSAMDGDAVVGWYNAAYNLVLSMKIVPGILLTALFPEMSRLFVSSKKSFKVCYEKLAKYLFIIGLPLTIGTSILADEIIPFFYGAQFAHSIIALNILAFDILLYFLYMVLLYLLVIMEKQKVVALIAGSCVLINIAINLILIPSFSYVGAAIATIFTETILLGLYFHFVSIYMYRIDLLKLAIKPSIACLSMAIFIYYFKFINLIAVIFLAAFFYFTVLLLLKTFTEDEIHLFKNARLSFTRFYNNKW